MSQEHERDISHPIVGIGASAGGLEAFEQFFSNMPADSGMTFVLVPHLDPTHKSILSDLIMQYTRMLVVQVSDGIKIEPNKAYIIPPNYDMTISHGKLYLSEIPTPRGLRLPIDHFFRSLALDQQEKAICIVLSGTGTDGTLGIREIKGAGGMAMVQDPITAKYDGMPRSAINNAIVDYVLPPDKMPDQLIKYVKKSVTPLKQENTISSLKFTDDLKEIFTLLKKKTNHDFSVYKENTMFRRIERRMVINHFNNISDYINYIRDHSQELEILFKELLIGVTNFFRDKEAFDFLEEKIIPSFFKESKLKKNIRIWVPGCSTGEEVYSIAILFQEYIDKINQDIKIQIFATDIDDVAIEKARLGIYPDSITADISPDRLKRFFELKGNLYQIKKKIRETVVFAVQNVIFDPPFSRVDLISCRNLLIYLNAEIQKKLVILFHYSLNPGGILFLGNSETISSTPTLFSEINRKLKLFQRIETPSFLIDIPRPFPPLIDHHPNKTHRKDINKEEFMNYRQVMEKFLLEHYSPPSVIINVKGDILYIHGKTNKFLEIQSGEAKMNIFQMVKEEVKLKLTTALRRILTKNEEVIYEKISLKSGNELIQLNLKIIPLLQPLILKDLFFVSFEEVPLEMPIRENILQIENLSGERFLRVKQLEDELSSTKQYLQTTIEELETTNEELQSSNEELQSSNEELQSTNEELQTSKEELQSLNEELTTINNELEAKITELRNINDDMRNLMVSSNIGTIFLDEKLNIKRFTPASKKIFNLIETDIGRPLNHISTNLVYDRMVQDAEEVLKTLIPKDIDVQIKDNGWFNMRIVPYRTEDNMIKGVVVTFFDITQRYLLEEEKVEALQFVDDIVETVRNPLVVMSKDLRIIRVNRAFYEFFKVTPSEVNGKYIYELGNTEWDIPELRDLLKHVISNHSIIQNFEVEHNFGKIGKRVMLLNAKEMIREKNKSLILLAIEDITDQKEFEKRLMKSKEEFQGAFNRAEFLKDLFTHDINNILQVILLSSELVSKSIDKPEKLTQIVKLNSIILEQIWKAQNIIGNIQLISNLEKGEGSKHPIKVHDIIEESIDYIKKSFRYKDLSINIQDFDKNLRIIANKLVNGVIENILINAIKHNDKENITIDIKISSEILETIKYVKFEFKDNGPGIKNEVKAKLFRKQFQKSSEGLGIGLTIVQKIVESYDGKIWVENRIPNDYSKGSNFILLIPGGELN
ncbi:MAG: PAS domain S-box protein [Promethearchaeota archaeon]|nr:MAG: PAS domain S-box protein [Candidatus Lokiarchaeota archaeon]